MNMLRMLIAGLALLVMGCSEESMRSMSDKEDLALSEQLVRDIQTGNQAGVTKAVLPEIQEDFVAAMPQFKTLLPSDPKAKLTLTSTSFKKSIEYKGKSVDIATLEYTLGAEKDETVVRVQIAKNGKERFVSRFDINPTDEEGDKEDLALSEQLVRDIQTGNQAGVTKAVLPEVQDNFVAIMPQLKTMLPSDPKAKLTLLSTSLQKSVEYKGKSIDVATLDYILGAEKDKTVVRVQIAKNGKERLVSQFDINPTDEEDDKEKS
jgi:Fe-S cluster assembly iron-binding protein IscA